MIVLNNRSYNIQFKVDNKDIVSHNKEYKHISIIPFMDIYYTNHAEIQINERKIQKAWVEETIKRPDIIKNLDNKFYVTKKLNGKTLKVVYVKEKYIKVITSFFVK